MLAAISAAFMTPISIGLAPLAMLRHMLVIASVHKAPPLAAFVMRMPRLVAGVQKHLKATLLILVQRSVERARSLGQFCHGGTSFRS